MLNVALFLILIYVFVALLFLTFIIKAHCKRRYPLRLVELALFVSIVLLWPLFCGLLIWGHFNKRRHT